MAGQWVLQESDHFRCYVQGDARHARRIAEGFENLRRAGAFFGVSQEPSELQLNAVVFRDLGALKEALGPSASEGVFLNGSRVWILEVSNPGWDRPVSPGVAHQLGHLWGTGRDWGPPMEYLAISLERLYFEDGGNRIWLDAEAPDWPHLDFEHVADGSNRAALRGGARWYEAPRTLDRSDLAFLGAQLRLLPLTGRPGEATTTASADIAVVSGPDALANSSSTSSRSDAASPLLPEGQTLAESTLERGRAALQLGNHSEARTLARAAVSIAPWWPDAHDLARAAAEADGDQSGAEQARAHREAARTLPTSGTVTHRLESLKTSEAAVPAAAVRAPPNETKVAQGRLQPELIRLEIRSKIHLVSACYQEQLARFPTLTGTVKVKFIIEPDGRVGEVENAGGSTIQSPELHACLHAVVRTMVFPPPVGGGKVIVSYPFTFRSL